MPDMITRRAFLWTALGVSGAGVLAACTPTAAPPPTVALAPTATAAVVPTAGATAAPPVPNADQAKQYAGQKVTVSTVDAGTLLFANMHDAMAARFTADTGIQAQVLRQTYNSSEALASMQNVLAAQSPDVDVMKIDVIWPGLLGAGLVDLNPILGTEAKQHYHAIIQNNTVDGRLVGMPWFADMAMLYYRTDLLEKYRLSRPPRTWEELEQQSNSIIEGEKGANPDFTGFVFQGVAAESLTCNVLEWLASTGGGTIVENGKVTINNPQAVAILNRIGGWTGKIAPHSVTSYAEEDARTAFQTGNAAFMRNWAYAYGLANAPDSPIRGKVAVAPLPASPGFKPVTTVGGWQLAVNTYSRSPQAAIEWVRYATGPEVQTYQALVGSLGRTIPAVAARQDVLQAEPFLTVLQDTVRVTRPAGVFGQHYDDASTVIYRGVNQVLNGQDAGRVLSDVQVQLERLLA
jgi:trehalose/maltose transport system substrate-binding protein